MKCSKILKPGFLLLAAISLLAVSSCKERAKESGAGDVIKFGGKDIYSDTATSSVKIFDQNGKVCIQQSNTYYELADLYEGTTRIPLLLKVRKTELCVADSTNKRKVFEISAKSILDTKNVNWDVKVVATNLQFKDNTVYSILEGDDNSEDYIQRFSLADGKPVFSSSYGELVIKIPNVKERRFIGYTSQKAASEPLKDMTVENLLGLVRYGSSSALGNGFKIKLKRTKVTAKVPATTPDMILVPANSNTTAIEDGKSLILMKADEHFKPTDVKDFALDMTFYYGDDNESTHVVVPIVNDKLDVSQAKYDKDLFEIVGF